MNFFLKKITSGKQVRTKSGYNAKFIALLPNNIPAPLIMEVNGVMENYYMNGRFYHPYESEMDLQVKEL